MEGLQSLYGNRLQAAILFGSRARGDHTFDSDFDIAVVLDGPVESRFDEVRAIGEFSYPLRFERGLHIQSLPLSAEMFARGDKPIIRNIKRDGIDLLTVLQ
ncbi:MAG: nucleotidyltransferase domain-containing protein [Pseudomonadota bacterium]